MNAVVVDGLIKRYAALAAVDGVNLTVELGEIFALLGPNGAGKTTTLEILEGFRHRDAGRVEVLGLDPGCPVVRPAATPAPAVAQFVLFPLVFISGTYFPIHSTVLYRIADVFPVRPLNEALIGPF